MNQKKTLRTLLLAKTLKRKLIRTLDINQINLIKKCHRFQHQKFWPNLWKALVLLKLRKEKEKLTNNSEKIYVLIKSCKENNYKTLVLAKRKNKMAPESSVNGSPPKSFDKKNSLKLVLVQLERKIQTQTKILKTLFFIKVINEITNKIFGPHKSLEKGNTISQRTLRNLVQLRAYDW